VQLYRDLNVGQGYSFNVHSPT